jgi:hypothetical protein
VRALLDTQIFIVLVQQGLKSDFLARALTSEPSVLGSFSESGIGLPLASTPFDQFSETVWCPSLLGVIR